MCSMLIEFKIKVIFFTSQILLIDIKRLSKIVQNHCFLSIFFVILHEISLLRERHQVKIFYN